MQDYDPSIKASKGHEPHHQSSTSWTGGQETEGSWTPVISESWGHGLPCRYWLRWHWWGPPVCKALPINCHDLLKQPSRKGKNTWPNTLTSSTGSKDPCLPVEVSRVFVEVFIELLVSPHTSHSPNRGVKHQQIAFMLKFQLHCYSDSNLPYWWFLTFKEEIITILYTHGK